MTEWIQVAIYLKTKEADHIDFVSHLLFEWGALGTQVENVTGYLENNENLFGEIPLHPAASSTVQKSIVSGFFDHSIDEKMFQQFLQNNLFFEYSWEQFPIKTEDWQKNWKKYYHIQSISRFIKIVPIWEDYTARFEDEKIIYLDPGVAFGTGDHPTTRLGAQALEWVMQGGETVFDVGTGSGVLAFIAYALGADRVIGYDLDPQAIDSAKNNLSLQKWPAHQPISGEEPAISFEMNDLLKGVSRSANIIVANILPHILVNLYDDAYHLLEKNGYLILGGILSEKAQEVQDSLSKEQWQIMQVNHYNGWVGIVAQKKE